MKKTTHYKGHRWTTEELKTLMRLWAEDVSMEEIAVALSSTHRALLTQIHRMRKAGIPLARRRKGHVAGRSNKSWTQGEVEYLIRRRAEKATADEIAMELGRSGMAVGAMIQVLRKENVPVAMRGMGVRRLWDSESLKAVAVNFPENNVIEMNPLKIAQ